MRAAQLGVPLVAGVALLAWFLLTYNRLAAHRERIATARAQIDVQLLRRHDLVPQLVAAVAAYLQYERDVLVRVAAARAAAVAAAPAAGPGRLRAEAGLDAALEDLRAVVEAHPRLRADVQVLHLQEDLASTENRIAAARRHYTFSVMRYHLARESFPQNVVARVAGFGPATYLELDAR